MAQPRNRRTASDELSRQQFDEFDLASLGKRVSTTRAAIGAEIRAARRELNLTQGEFARKLGLSPGMISKIEHGSVAASIEILITIAHALSVPLMRFFQGLEEEQTCRFIPSGGGLLLNRDGSERNFRHQLLAHSFSESGACELVRMFADRDAKPFFCRRSGLAVVHMLSGKIHYRHGERTYLLQPGDTLQFDAMCLHGPDSVLSYPVDYLLWLQPQVEIDCKEIPLTPARRSNRSSEVNI